MCSRISWFQFLVFLLAADALYYVYIGLRYYRKDWWCRLRSRKQPAPAPVSFPRPAVVPAGISSKENDVLPPVQDLVNEIRALLQGIGEGAEKVVLLEKLRLLLQKYPTLHQSPFQPSIKQLIAVETGNHCDVVLDEEDLDGLWS